MIPIGATDAIVAKNTLRLSGFSHAKGLRSAFNRLILPIVKKVAIPAAVVCRTQAMTDQKPASPRLAGTSAWYFSGMSTVMRTTMVYKQLIKRQTSIVEKPPTTRMSHGRRGGETI